MSATREEYLRVLAERVHTPCEHATGLRIAACMACTLEIQRAVEAYPALLLRQVVHVIPGAIDLLPADLAHHVRTYLRLP